LYVCYIFFSELNFSAVITRHPCYDIDPIKTWCYVLYLCRVAWTDASFDCWHLWSTQI